MQGDKTMSLGMLKNLRQKVKTSSDDKLGQSKTGAQTAAKSPPKDDAGDKPIGSFSVMADALNVRTGPGKSFGIAGVLKKGATVEAVGQSDGWLKIYHKGEKAWISEKYAKPAEGGGKTEGGGKEFSSAEIAEIKSWYKKQNYTKDFIGKFQAVVGTKPDRAVGPDTINAVAAWQKANKLEADGKFGKKSADKAGLTVEKNKSGGSGNGGGSGGGKTCGEPTKEQRELGEMAVKEAEVWQKKFNKEVPKRKVYYSSRDVAKVKHDSTWAGNYSQKDRGSYYKTMDSETQSYYYDCSSFTYHSWKEATGIKIGTYSGAQNETLGGKCSIGNDNKHRIPGDILWRSGHVAIYVGNGRALDAGGGKYPKKLRKITEKTDLSEFTKTFRPSGLK